MLQVGLEPVLIAAVNTPDPTLAQIAKLSSAYTYCVSRAGITGTHAAGRFDASLIERLKAAGAAPSVFGFGIANPEHISAALAAGASGVICGSALVSQVVRSASPLDCARRFTSTLKAATLNFSLSS